MDENNARNKLEKIRYMSMQSSIICDMHVLYDTCIYKKIDLQLDEKSAYTLSWSS